MAARFGYRVTVYERELKRLFNKGQPADRFIYKVSARMMAESRSRTPVRSGELRNAHIITRGSRIGSNQYQSRYSIENVSDHAGYVHDGTLGSISADGMSLPEGGPSAKNSKTRWPGQTFSKRTKYEVRGQRANPWLEEACTVVAMRYGARLSAL